VAQLDHREFGISRLDYNDEYLEYHGTIQLNGADVELHFPLVKLEAEGNLIARRQGMLTYATSQTCRLLEQAQMRAGDPLPAVGAIIFYDDTFDLQFGSSNPDEQQLWYEAMYDQDGALYHFAKHEPHLKGT
jgi:hypothetical protein